MKQSQDVTCTDIIPQLMFFRVRERVFPIANGEVVHPLSIMTLARPYRKPSRFAAGNRSQVDKRGETV